jgi:hypothetical protein
MQLTARATPGRGATAALWALATIGAVVSGVALARGDTLGWVVAAAVVGAAALPLCALYGDRILLAWIALSAVAVPFLRVPPYVTFDRVLGVAALAWLLLTRREQAEAGAPRFLRVTLLIFVASYGVRAATGGLSAEQTWFDAIAIPAIAYFAVARMATTLRSVEQVAAALTVAGATMGVLGLMNKLTGIELATRSGGEIRRSAELGGTEVLRISGPYPVPEVFGVALIVALAGTLYWTLVRPSPQRYLIGLSVVVVECAALGFTLFRAAWIGAFIVVVITLGLRPRRYGRVIGVAVAIGALALAGSTQLRNNQTFETRVQNTDNVSGRLATYQQATTIFTSAPAVGVGVDRYFDVAPGFVPPTVDGVASVPYPHSSYFGLLAEQGLLGFIPFILFNVAVWYLLRRYRWLARDRGDVILAAAVTGGVLAYVLMSLTLTMLPYGSSNLLLMVLLGAVAGRVDALSAQRRAEAPPASGALG